MNNITYAQFAAWNPAVEPDCQGLWLDYSYCVSMTNFTGTGDDNSTSPSTTITAVPTSGSQSSSVFPTSATPPGPTQSGQPADCVAWYVAQKGDTCDTVEKEYKISDQQFHQWNPAVSSDCSSGFWADEAYCVGVSDDNPGTIAPTTTTTSTSSTSPAAAPSPTQANSIAANCNKYAQAPSGSYCSLFAQDNNISENNLYAWNTVLGANGANCGNDFWSGYYYCIGVSS
jgi:LysM repeat protein